MNAPDRKIGDYTLIEVLGRGSYGTVWRARHDTLNRVSAVKLFDGPQSTGLNNQRVIREAQISAGLKHPNIIRVYEVGRSVEFGAEMTYIVYDLIDGVTLEEWAEFADLNNNDIGTLMMKLASALTCAHDRGIIHRDLKPENILVDLTGEPYIADFGLASRLDDRITYENVAMGTVAYMSPEQAIGDSASADARSDIFSLGVILFEMLTGELPFSAVTIPGYLAQLAATDAPSPHDIKPDIPRDLATICEKCLRRDPDGRYASARLFQDDMKRFLDGRPVLARPVGIGERMRKWAVRQPLAATLLAILVVISVVGPTTALYQARLRTAFQHQNERLETQSQRLRSQTRQLRETNYAKDLQAAYRLRDEGRILQCIERLDRHVPVSGEADLRNFPWYLLRDQVNAMYQVVARSETPLYDAVLINRDRLATVGTAAELAIWNIASASPIASIPLPSGNNFALAFDAKRFELLVGTKRDGLSEVVVCNLVNHKIDSVTSLDSRQTIESIRIAPNQDRVSVGMRHYGVMLLDDHLQRVAFLRNHDRHESVCYSPNGQFLVTTSTHKDVAPSPIKRSVRLWDAVQGKLIAEAALQNKPTAIAVSPDARTLVVCEDRTCFSAFQLPDLDKKQTVAIPSFRDVRYLTYSSDGRLLIAGCIDGVLFCIPANAFTAERREPTATVLFLHKARLFNLVTLPDGRVFTCGEDGIAAIVDIPKWIEGGGRVVAERGDRVDAGYCVVTSTSDPNLVLIGDRNGNLMNDQGNVLIALDETISSLAISSNDRTIACGMSDGRILIVDATSWSIQQVLAPKDNLRRPVKTVAFAPDGNSLLSGGEDQVNRYWTLPDGEEVILGEITDTTFASAVTPGGRLLTGGRNEQIHVYDHESHQLLFELPAGGTEALLYGGSDVDVISVHRDGGVRLWDLAERRLVATLRGHDGEVLSGSLRADGNIFVTGGKDGTVRLWDIGRREEIGIIARASPGWTVRDACFTADGRSILAVERQPNGHEKVMKWTSTSLP